MRKNTLATFAALGAAGLTLAACSGSSGTTDAGDEAATGSGEAVTWRLALNQTDDHPLTVAVNNFADRVAERTDGRFEIQVFPNETLGAQQETLQLVMDDTLSAAIVSGPQLENVNTDFLVFNLPLVFDDIEHQMSVVNDDEIVGELYASLEESENISVLGAFTAGDRNLYTVDAPVLSPADMGGLKIRVQESETHLRMIELMGGSPTPMAFGEVYAALQGGVLDGAENNEVSYVTQKHFEVAKHFSYTRHLIVPDYLVTSTAALEALSEEDRAIFDEEFDAAVTEQVELWITSTEEAIAEAEAGGVQFHEVDTQAFADAIAPLVEDSLTTDLARTVYDATRAAAQ
jgi:tripartite ATP-independent transporter DctP family solute receptor